MNIKKILLLSCFFIPSLLHPALMTVQRPTAAALELENNHPIIIGHARQEPLRIVLKGARHVAKTLRRHVRSGELILHPRVQTQQNQPEPQPVLQGMPEVVPSQGFVAHMSEEFKQKFSTIAPVLAVAAFAVQHANVFVGRYHQDLLSRTHTTFGNQVPQRLNQLLHENAEMEQKLNWYKNFGWQSALQLARAHPQFNQSYESLQNAQDQYYGECLVKGNQKIVAHNHFKNRLIAQVTASVAHHINKGLIGTYKMLSSFFFSPEPSIKKTTINLLATLSIQTIVTPNIIHYCAKPHSPMRCMIEQKGLQLYNFVPKMVKTKVLALKNWYNAFITNNNHH